jgi:hypothetical protein
MNTLKTLIVVSHFNPEKWYTLSDEHKEHMKKIGQAIKIILGDNPPIFASTGDQSSLCAQEIAQVFGSRTLHGASGPSKHKTYEWTYDEMVKGLESVNWIQKHTNTKALVVVSDFKFCSFLAKMLYLYILEKEPPARLKTEMGFGEKRVVLFNIARESNLVIGQERELVET